MEHGQRTASCDTSLVVSGGVLRKKTRNVYYAPAPVGEAGALGGHRHPSSVRPSVRLSDVAYIGSNSKTKKPRKTKLCTEVPQVTCDSHTDFKVKRSKVKVTGRRHIVASTKRAATWRTAAHITSLNIT